MKTTLLALTATTVITATLFAQGDLNPPPGGPTATMKTLDQLEARTPIPKSPAVPIAGPHFAISQPGSYYLTGNITVSTGDAILISSDDVSLDLNGFTVRSTLTGSANGTAIYITGSRKRLKVTNGSIVSGTTVAPGSPPTPAGFERGIYSNATINQASITDLHLSGLGSGGIILDGEGIIERCTVRECGGVGLVGSVLRDCIAKYCKGDAISGENATNCCGSSINGRGVSCTGNIINCVGESDTGTGVYCDGNAMNSTGKATTGFAFYCGANATNCNGSSSNPNILALSVGMFVQGTANSCRAERTGGGSAGLSSIAIGCSSNGIWNSSQKHLGTP